VQNIVYEYLGITKLSARWVPRLLAVDNKRNRMTTSKQCFYLFKRNPKKFIRRFVSVDEIWIHHYMPEMKEESKQWSSPGKQAPKNANTVPSKGIIFIDYLEKGRTITGQYYDQLWGKFNDALKEEESAVPPSQCAVTLIFVAAAKLVELGCKLLSHSPYSPNLAPYDFFLFPNMKKWVGEKRFASNEEVITESEAY
jgi:histone-lysine N-methyltransferase SETMAR